MSEQCEQWDKQWGELLTRSYGPEVQASFEFRANLLADLKKKVAERKVETETEEDGKWRLLLTKSYVPCTPSPEFKEALLPKLRAMQLEVAPISDEERQDTTIRNLLTKTYSPIAPRREFETRLLENLKERQRNTRQLKVVSRRKTLFLSGISGMAAAAAVLFVVWAMPVAERTPDIPPLTFTAGLSVRTPEPVGDFSLMSASLTAPTAGNSVQSPNAVAALAALDDSYSVDKVFAGLSLPQTVHGVGMEMDAGDGWTAMDESAKLALRPGMRFRPASLETTPKGLGFGDGSSMFVMSEDAVVDATERGMLLASGEVMVTVPEGVEDSFRLHFPERDIAVESGTTVVVAAKNASDYADGGAPAPVVMVLDGGMALAKGPQGSGPLFGNQVYLVDNYVTPALPGRPLCAVECEQLAPAIEEFNRVSPDLGPGLLVSLSENSSISPAAPKGFVKRGSRWQSNDYANEPTVRIQYLSDEYFGFANARRDLAPALSLGSEVVIDGGDGNYYEIYE